MKKLLYIPLLFLAFSVHAQNGIVLKMKYTPNHTYAGGINMDIKAKVNLSGNDTVVSKLTAQGLTLPITLDMVMKMDGNTKTGEPSAAGTFPLTMLYKIDSLSMDINGNKVPIPTDKIGGGSAIYGHVGADGKLKADSISGSKMTDTSEAHITQMMNTIQKNINFPDHPMKPGDSFTQDMPLNIPIAGNSVAANSKATYKLLSVDGDNAKFDVTQSMDMTITVKGVAVHLSGSGSGKMVYSIKNNFATEYTALFNMTVTGSIKSLQINATATMDMDYRYVIN